MPTASSSLPAAAKLARESICLTLSCRLSLTRATRIRSLLVHEGRKYRLVGIGEDGSGLYRHRQFGRDDFWIRLPDGKEKPWSYLTCFGRKRTARPARRRPLAATTPERCEDLPL